MDHESKSLPEELRIFNVKTALSLPLIIINLNFHAKNLEDIVLQAAAATLFSDWRLTLYKLPSILMHTTVIAAKPQIHGYQYEIIEEVSEWERESRFLIDSQRYFIILPFYQ